MAGTPGTPGFSDGKSALFDQPRGICSLPDGRIVVSDFNNHRLRLVNPDGEVSTLAGSGAPGTTDGCATRGALLFHPVGVAVDPGGKWLAFSDYGSHLIRKLCLETDIVSTVAGFRAG